MASLGEDIRTFLLASTALGGVMPDKSKAGVIEQNTMRENAPSPRIWYQRAGEEIDLDLSNENGLNESRWNIEVHSTGDDQRWNIADAVRGYAHGHIGAMGTHTVQTIKVEEHDDDYTPRGVASEEGLYVAALAVTIWYDAST